MTTWKSVPSGPAVDPHTQAFTTGSIEPVPAPSGGANATWNPNDAPADPHDEDYTVTHGASPVTGPIPSNIQTGGPGPFSQSKQRRTT